MSSTIDQNILQNHISHRRTIHFFIDLDETKTPEPNRLRKIDLTESQFGALDFKPDEVYVKYVGFQSQHQNHDDLATFNCDFIVENTTLCPFVSRTTIQSFHNLRYRCKSQMDIRNVKIWVESIVGNTEGETTVASGNVAVAVEFRRYLRCNERVIW
jgi:hypothetical protein